MRSTDKKPTSDGALLYFLAQDIRQFRNDLKKAHASSAPEGADPEAAEPVPGIEQLDKWLGMIASMPAYEQFSASGRSHDAFGILYRQELAAAGGGMSLSAILRLIGVSIAQIVVLGAIFAAAMVLMLNTFASFQGELGAAISGLLALGDHLGDGSAPERLAALVNSSRTATGLALLLMFAAYLVAWFTLAGTARHRRNYSFVRLGAGVLVIVLSGIFLGLIARGFV